MNLFYSFLMMVASVLISTALATRQKPQEPASLEDFDFPQVDEGTPQCVVFGDCWTSDWQVLGYGDFRTEPIRVRSPKK